MGVRIKLNRRAKVKSDAEIEADRYRTARREWDMRTSKYLHTLRSFQTIAVLGLISIFICLYYMGSYIQKPRLVPYVIQEKPDGSITFAGEMQLQKLTIDDAAVQNYIRRFILDLRSISSDKVILKNSLSDLYYFLSDNCKRKVTESILKSKPFEKSDHEIHVDIRFNVFERVSEKTWRAEWVEEVREQGTLKDQIPMSGTFTYHQETISDGAKVINNLFGLFFDDFYMQERKN
jgi:type IV secretory pathway TrbF-like protein